MSTEVEQVTDQVEAVDQHLTEHTEVAHGDAGAYGHAAFYADPTFWVAVAFVLFFVLLAYMKVHKTLAKLLDDRSDKIAAQINEARTLREEAQSLLAKYQRQQMEASKEAEDIIAHAQEDAKIIAIEAEKSLAELIERRGKMAEDKIAQAEAHAVQEVQQAAVTVAMAAARTLIAGQMKGDLQGKLVDAAVADLDKNIH